MGYRGYGVLLLLCGFPLLSEGQRRDNPDLDQVPWYLLEQSRSVTDAPASPVITLGNWDNFSLGVDFAENNMAVNPLQPAWFFTAYNTNAPHHTENGIDWSVHLANFGTTMKGDPVVAYDSLGNLFYENMYGSISGCKVIASVNNGITWGAPVTAIAGNDKNWIACDQTAGPYANHVYTTMTNNGAGNFARSTNHGASFTSTFAPSTQNLPGMMVCVGPQGNIQGGAVYVVTNSGSSAAATYTFYRSTDGGATFQQRSSVQWPNYVGTYVNSRNSVQGMRTRPYPMIASDNSYGPFRGRLYCVYASNTPAGSGNKPDIFCRYSADGGATWSGAVLVNDDPNPTAHHQWHPSVWCDKETGRLYVMWMDTRDTPTSDSAFIYATYSVTGGASFLANQRISNARMKIDCSTCGGGGTPRYQGDYNGVVSNRKTSMVGWTDFRAGTFQSMTAYFPDFAMAVTPASQTLYTAVDSVLFEVSVPAVKLYSDTVILSAVISPVPVAGSLVVTYPAGNILTSFPGSKPVRIRLWGEVPAGTYTVTFTAAGPNGTPVHRRTATLTVAAGDHWQASVTLQPDRAVCQGDTIHIPVGITGSFIHSATLFISYDTSVLTPEAPYFGSVYPGMAVSCYPSYEPGILAVTMTLPGTSGISLSGTPVINLVFSASGAGPALLHIRSSPDPEPRSGIYDGAGVAFSRVQYTDNAVASTASLPVSVTLSSQPALPVFAGTPVTLNAVADGGGSAPLFEWFVNSVGAGNPGPQYAYVPANGDTVVCILHSSSQCCPGNPTAEAQILMTVLAASQSQQLQNISIGDSSCFGAPQSILVAGNGTAVHFLPGSNVTLVSGQNIYFFPESHAEQGAAMHAHISTNGILCGLTDHAFINAAGMDPEGSTGRTNVNLRIYPNPATTEVSVILTGRPDPGSCRLTVTGPLGQVMAFNTFPCGEEFRISVRQWPQGIYHVTILIGREILTGKLLVGGR